MPLNRDQIKHSANSREIWRDNRTGVMTFDPRKIRPLSDHVLIELDREDYDALPARYALGSQSQGKSRFSGSAPRIVVPQTVVKDIGSRVGTVLAVGPGKYREKRIHESSWEDNPWVFKPTTLKPGDRVVIGHYSDWESWNCSADGHQSRDKNIVLCQEADVRVIAED